VTAVAIVCLLLLKLCKRRTKYPRHPARTASPTAVPSVHSNTVSDRDGVWSSQVNRLRETADGLRVRF
jgi:hypothetical protein